MRWEYDHTQIATNASLKEHLNERGVDGWELVGVTTKMHDNGREQYWVYDCVWKRRPTRDR